MPQSRQEWGIRARHCNDESWPKPERPLCSSGMLKLPFVL
jgi:hypothetical protein